MISKYNLISKYKLLAKVEDKMREDSQDIQMGLGQTYFEELVEFIREECKK